MTRMHMFAAVVATALMAPVAPALAGGYISAGVGSGAVYGGDLGEHFSGENLDAGRLALGTRRGMLALEASFASGELRGRPDLMMDSALEPRFASRSLGASLKLHLGLLGPIEGYVRGGVHRTWISAMNNASTDDEMSGNALALGGGVHLPVRLIPGVQLAVWADYDRQMLTLSGPEGGAVDGSTDQFMLGLSVGTQL